MKNISLGIKILAGFGILIVITCILGGIAVYDMREVEKTALVLSKENIPEVAVANNVERTALSTVYEVRGYAYTESQQFLEDGRRDLGRVKQYLKDAKAHGESSPNLAKLKDAAEKAETATLEYERLLEETVKLTSALETERQSAEAAAKKYMDSCYTFMKIQEDLFESELKEGKDISIIQNRNKNITTVNDIIDLGNWIITGTWKSQFRRDPKLFSETKTLFGKVYEKLDELKGRTIDANRLKMIEDCRSAGKAYEKHMETFLAAWLAREDVGSKRVRMAEQVIAEAKRTAELGMKDTTSAAESAAFALAASSRIMTIGLAVAAVVGIIVAFLITRGITRPVRQVVEGLTDASDQVASASNQISSSSQHLAEGASEQAASLEETSSSLEEMASMTRQNADNAGLARAKMGEAQNIIERVNGHMDDMARAVEEITQSSEETGKIIKSIDEIAFQTNLLALNAAVEAARAGEAGAGFAVVADEVRNLAMRAAEAAKVTSNLIESTIKAVRNGNDLTRSTQAAFKENMEITEDIARLVDEIATASNEQSHGIGQLNTAVADMDKVTQNVAANAEESASAAEEMNAQAMQLKSYVGHLQAIVGGKAGHDGGKSSPTRTPRRAGATTTVREEEPRIFTKARISSGKSNGKAVAHRPGGREVRPEQLIPFDDDKMGEF